MNIHKIFWAFRAIVYKLRFKSIGMPSYIGKPIFIENAKNIKLGNKCRIYPGMRAEIVNDFSSLTIGNDVSIGQNFHVVSLNDELIIGDHVTISGNVLITNCDHSYKIIGEHILKQPMIEKKTQIGNGCFIGYGSVIQAGTILGKQCIVGANSVVRGSFPNYSVIVGAPAKVVKRYDMVNEKWEKE